MSVLARVFARVPASARYDRRQRLDPPVQRPR